MITKEQRARTEVIWTAFHREVEEAGDAFADGRINIGELEMAQAQADHTRDERLSRMLAGEWDADARREMEGEVKEIVTRLEKK